MLACGATAWRDLPIPGRELDGIHQAMEYLPWGNRVQEGDLDAAPITAEGKHVIIIGGGDTGADCLGTAHRQGAASVTQLEILPRPPDSRRRGEPLAAVEPDLPHDVRPRGGRRAALQREHRVLPRRRRRAGAEPCDSTRCELVDGRFEKVEGTDREIPASSCCWPWASSARRRGPGWTSWAWRFDERGNVARRDDFMTSVPGVFAAGDMGRGQSLIVWAIAEGRACAAGVDRWLMGETSLPAPVLPTTRPLTIARRRRRQPPGRLAGP